MTDDRQTIVGRAAERAALSRFIDAVSHGPAAVVVTGEAGIGKSTIWREGLRLAAANQYEVLQCRPVQSEAQLAFTALSDLFGEIPPAALDRLPAPQRKALEVALLLSEPEGEDVHPRAVGLATIALLTARAAQRPVVVAIDDAHWLDHASQRVLAFAFRRLGAERIGVLCTSRQEDGSDIVTGLLHDVDFPLNRIQVGAVQPADLEQILHARLTEPLDRRDLSRVEQASGGNPLFALQLGQALIDRDVHDEQLPIPASLQQLLADQLDSLGPGLAAVQAAAIMSRPTVALLVEMFGASQGRDSIQAAVDAGVLTLEGDRLAFTHPLLATAASARLDRDSARQLHLTVATVVDDVEERARHLAMATDQPDGEVADALDTAARRARARFAPDAAAELWEAAARLTPADEGEARRMRRAEVAECRFESGEIERSLQIFEDILSDAPPGPTRRRVLSRWPWTVGHIHGFSRGAAAFRTALPELGDDLAAEIEAQQGLAWCLHETSGVRLAEQAARRALALAERSGHPHLVSAAVALVAFLRSMTGDGLALAEVARAVETSEFGEWPQILGRADWIHGMLLEWEEELGAARDHFRRLRDDSVARGNEQSLPFILFHMARTELLIGDWSHASEYAAGCYRTTVASGQMSERPFACVVRALVDAHLGRVEEASAEITEGLELAERYAVVPATMELLATRGFLELSLGQHAEADVTLTTLERLTDETEMREPSLFRHHGDAVEAKIALGRLEEAAALLEQTATLAAALDRPTLRLIVARGGALLAAAHGSPDEASDTLTTALSESRSVQPFEQARTWMALGSIHRRNRKKFAARTALANASATFERLGARLWLERADAESARIGGRPPAAGLTPTEWRVAQLIAAGRSYKEAAAELFISPKTVQWNLSKVYTKLGIRSRAELPGRLEEG